MSTWRDRWFGWLRDALAWRPLPGAMWVAPENEIVRRVYAGPVRLPPLPWPAVLSQSSPATAIIVAEAPGAGRGEAAAVEARAPVEADDPPIPPEKQPIPFPGRAA